MQQKSETVEIDVAEAAKLQQFLDSAQALKDQIRVVVTDPRARAIAITHIDEAALWVIAHSLII